MLDLGFIHALKRIVALVPPKRQTLFFSATMPRAIKELADKYLSNPAEVSVTPAATTVQRIDQRVTMVNQAEKSALLALLLQNEPVERALVFSRTKHGADKIVKQLAAANIASGAIHGNKSQAQRERTLAAFKSGETKVLIATDIAARGIDVPGVSHVVNFDLPDVPEQYVHRIGRTARAGADGIAIAFCAPDERGNLRDIERTTRQRLPIAPLPQDFTASAEAFKRLKPPVEAKPERSPRDGFKADRRHDGQQRKARNGGGQRHPQRGGPQDRNGQRRDDHRGDATRTSYRPEVFREADADPRAARSSEARGPARPQGGQPKRKFHGRSRRPGGYRAA
jgi:ATP-dependent RNA helicase RhlE